MKTGLYIGIDPGALGALAALGEDGELHIQPFRNMDTASIWQVINKYSPQRANVIPLAVIEKVGGYMPGGRGNIGSAMFTFGVSYGKLLMALTAAGFRLGFNLKEVTPLSWQGFLGLLSTGKEKVSRSDHKRKLLGYARSLFPDAKITLATADAVLLAVYCQWLQKGGGPK